MFRFIVYRHGLRGDSTQMILAIFCQAEQKLAIPGIDLFDTHSTFGLSRYTRHQPRANHHFKSLRGSMKLRSPYVKHLQESIMQEFILGSDVMRSIMTVVHEVAKYDVNVLLLGESGTGKEMLAKIIHLQSPRAEHPFVPVNCGMLSGLMFEDKLFGHEKGSFTGAIRRQEGCFEMANKGTLFLDEVSEVPLENQTDFLRVLEEFRLMRIGGNELIRADVRIISATNKDLKVLVKQGLFREDLFYRLHVVPVHIPPLRERKMVIPKMVDHFLSQLAVTYKKPKPLVESEVIDTFCRYDWPGNVRELKNLLERVFIVNDDPVMGMGHLPSDFLWHFRALPNVMDLGQIRRAAETEAILDVLRRVGGDKARASKILRISPRTLRYKLQRYNIRMDRRGDPLPEDVQRGSTKGLSLKHSSRR